MLTRLVINTATLSTFDLNNITSYRSLIVFLDTLILLIGGVIVRKIWSIKHIGKTIYNLLPNSLTKQWQAYDEWVIQTKKIFDTIEVLRQSEERFRVIFEAAAVGISHTGIDGRILRTNPKFCQIVGYEASELLSMRFQDITHPGDLLLELSLQQKLLKLEQTSYHIEKRYIRRDGTLVWIKLSVSVICDSNGKPIELIKVIEDISDRKNAELALRRSEERYRSLVAATSQIVCISDENGNLTHMFAGAGYRVKDIEGLQRVGWVERIHPEDLPQVQQAWQFAHCNKSFYEVEHRLMDADGNYRYMQTRAVPVLSEDGNVREWISAITDISTRKQAEAELLERAIQKLADTQAQLIQNEKMSSLRQLVAGVAHEINNPVSFIYGNISHIHEYTQDLLKLVLLYKQHYPKPSSCINKVLQAIDLDFIQEDLPKILSSMIKGADRIRQIVLSLRNFSRLDEASLKAVDIHEGIDSTLLILQSRLSSSSNAPNIEIVKQYGAIGKIECYAGQLNQVFMNILNNAIDAIYNLGSHRPGKIVINTNINEQSQVVINIIDNGCGMNEETRRRIYDPFFTTKPVGSGNGLGMAVSYKIIEKHGGKLECSSTVGEGTKFTILLPKQP
ncbi:hypothetical protein DSM106972_077610 [Dulcicalothrix desertica PCC 7102]|uniref:histidine kinase n=1 Tax=Dulcicalothrix desertica PCC 7102 TaxID=232991 RepID=A0A3S1C9C9_9CYAN|nr:PAS domain S-box protein [Dulcicalothrix desertica]RUS99319.1 hypothetical protein DSM106972_077610 [Dulcicalothrix desertica PCC 7102]TWH49982.1 PAS domain S-box-containing protein [Dulcicalothrix desertica PCC 7102]